MTVITADGVRLWDMFEDVAGMLDGRATVIPWYQRGCGRSQRCAGPWTTDRFVAGRRHFGPDRMALLGHSWGARLALSYTLAHPERVSALVCVSGTGIAPKSQWHGACKENLAARLDQVPEHLARRRKLPERAVLQRSADFATGL